MVQVSVKAQIPPGLAQVGVEVMVPAYPLLLSHQAEAQMPILALVA